MVFTSWMGYPTFVTAPTPPENSNLLHPWTDNNKMLLGMVHLGPLPGSPGTITSTACDVVENVTENALCDARTLLENGMDGLILENFGDTPFYPDRVPPITIAAITTVAHHVRELATRVAPGAFLGVNVLRNDAGAALAIAAACGFHGIRVNVHTGVMAADQGILEGRAHDTLRERARLRAPVAILADVLVKHAEPLGEAAPDIGPLAREAVERGGADGIIVSGRATGSPTDTARLESVRAALPNTPIFIGSGASVAIIAAQLRHADGAIVGTALKKNGDVHAPVDPVRVRAIVEAVKS